MSLRGLLIQVLATVRAIVHVEQVRGEPLVISGRRLIPVTRVFRIRGFGRQGGWGLIWNRPVAMLEELEEGIYRSYRIPDVTLQTVAAIMTVAMILRVLLALLSPALLIALGHVVTAGLRPAHGGRHHDS